MTGHKSSTTLYYFSPMDMETWIYETLLKALKVQCVKCRRSYFQKWNIEFIMIFNWSNHQKRIIVVTLKRVFYIYGVGPTPGRLPCCTLMFLWYLENGQRVVCRPHMGGCCWLQSAASPLDATKSYTLDFQRIRRTG